MLIGEPEERWAAGERRGLRLHRASSEDLHSRNRAGKAVLNVPDEAARRLRRRRAAGRRSAARGASTRKGGLLVFPVADLPELPRGKGNKIFGIPTKKSLVEAETLLAIAAVAPGQTLRVLMRRAAHGPVVSSELAEYRGERGQRGAVLPRGWRKVDGLEVEG